MTTEKKEKIRNEKIINQIVERIKQGGASCFVRHWDAPPVQSIRGRKYTYENTLSLFALQAVGKTVPVFLTYKQAQNFGGLKKGCRGACVRSSWYTLEFMGEDVGGALTSDELDELDDAEKVFHKRYNTVFSVSDVVDPLPEWIELDKKFSYSSLEQEEMSIGTDIICDKIKFLFSALRVLPVDVKIGGFNPVALPEKKLLIVPHLKDYKGCKSAFIASVLHELTHALRRELKRPPIGIFWSREAEEMTAEIGGLFLANVLNLPYTVNNSLEYILSWFNRSCGSSELALAIDRAQKSTDYIYNRLAAAGLVPAAGDNY